MTIDEQIRANDHAVTKAKAALMHIADDGIQPHELEELQNSLVRLRSEQQRLQSVKSNLPGAGR